MAKTYEGKVTHYGGSSGIIFQFSEDKKDKDGVMMYSPSLDLAFEIYKAFRDNKVKVTIEKIKE